MLVKENDLQKIRTASVYDSLKNLFFGVRALAATDAKTNGNTRIIGKQGPRLFVGPPLEIETHELPEALDILCGCILPALMPTATLNRSQND